MPLDFLRGLGLSDIYYQGAPAVRIPYLGPDAAEATVQFRLALDKGDGVERFKFKAGTKPCLYGLNG